MLKSAELETTRESRNLTTVIAANVEVQTDEEATVYVHELDLFVTVQILEDTPAVPSLGKLCEDHGYSYEWASGQKPHCVKKVEKPMRHRKLCTDRCPSIIDRFFQFHCKYISYIGSTGNS